MSLLFLSQHTFQTTTGFKTKNEYNTNYYTTSTSYTPVYTGHYLVPTTYTPTINIHKGQSLAIEHTSTGGVWKNEAVGYRNLTEMSTFDWGIEINSTEPDYTINKVVSLSENIPAVENKDANEINNDYYDEYDILPSKGMSTLKSRQWDNFPIRNKVSYFLSIEPNLCKKVQYVEVYNIFGFKKFYLYDYLNQP